jgi:phosphoribosylanthranilate isomerase
MPIRPRIKICCIQDEGELTQALAAGASALGFVSEMPSGPGPIPEESIAALIRRVPPSVSAFLLTALTNARDIVLQQRRLGADTVQLVDQVPPGQLFRLRRELPGVRLVQVIHVEGPEAVERAHAVAGFVDGLLLDSGRPGAKVKELGGTGRIHDWSISARIRREVKLPVFLAGGLTPENVAQAIAEVEPFGVDVCSGLRKGGALDAKLLERFVAAVGA